MEVLIALSLASVVLVVLLSSLSQQVNRVAVIEPKYRAMLVASMLLEKAMDKHQSSDEQGNEQSGTNDSFTSGSFSNNKVKLETVAYPYQITVKSVPADPRIDQVTVVIDNPLPGRTVRFTAYRLRSQTKDTDSEVSLKSDSKSLAKR